MTMTRKLTLVTAAALLATGLGACSRSEREPAAADNQAMEAAETPAPLATATPQAGIATPAATPALEANATAEALPEAATPPDAQMMDDASATGMTARASRGEHASNEAAAAGQPEE